MAGCEGRLNAAILELSGGEVETQIRFLAAFEKHAAGSIANQQTGGGGDPDQQPNAQSRTGPSAWTSHAFLAPSAGPGTVSDPALQECDSAQACWLPDGPEAESIAIRLRKFAMLQFALVERSLHGRLLALWESIPKAERWDPKTPKPNPSSN